MNLEILLARTQEIEVAITNASAQLNALHGHKAETEHWIQKLRAEVAEDNQAPIECEGEIVLE